MRTLTRIRIRRALGQAVRPLRRTRPGAHSGHTTHDSLRERTHVSFHHIHITPYRYLCSSTKRLFKMPTSGPFTVSIEPVSGQSALSEVDLQRTTSKALSCFVAVPAKPSPSDDYGPEDVPYVVRWAIEASALEGGGLQVQVEWSVRLRLRMR